ncbi:MAG: DUF2007 domain-containing protein [Bacteroidota bacterium]
MTRVYSNPDPAVAHLVRNAIDQIGVPAIVRNDGTATLMEIPTVATWAEVWVAAGDRLGEVEQIVAEVLTDAPADAEAWDCDCGETVEGAFGACWSCGTPAPEAV